MKAIPVCIIVCGTLLLASCSKRESLVGGDVFADADATNVVAKVNGCSIELARFQELWSRAGSRMNKEAALEQLISHDTLVAQAKAAGYDRDPDLLAAFEQMLASRFQERELAKRAAQRSQISEAEIAEAYQRDVEKYTTAAAVRAGVIFLAGNPRATPEKQAELKQRAEEILAQARASDAAGYSELVQRYSEDQATRYRGGDVGWFKAGDLEARWEPAVASAVFELKRVGEVAPLISTSRGLYIVRLADTRPATARPLREVTEAIRYQLTQARQQQLQTEFVEEVRRNSRIEINQALLDSLPERTDDLVRHPPPLPGG